MIALEVQTAPELAAAIRQHAGTEAVLKFGSLTLTFHEVPELDRLEFHACAGHLNNRYRSTWTWRSAWELVELEGRKAKPPTGFSTFEEYLLKMHPSRDVFREKVEAMAKAWEKMPRKAWPKS